MAVSERAGAERTADRSLHVVIGRVVPAHGRGGGDEGYGRLLPVFPGQDEVGDSGDGVPCVGNRPQIFRCEGETVQELIHRLLRIGLRAGGAGEAERKYHVGPPGDVGPDPRVERLVVRPCVHLLIHDRFAVGDSQAEAGVEDMQCVDVLRVDERSGRPVGDADVIQAEAVGAGVHHVGVLMQFIEVEAVPVREEGVLRVELNRRPRLRIGGPDQCPPLPQKRADGGLHEFAPFHLQRGRKRGGLVPGGSEIPVIGQQRPVHRIDGAEFLLQIVAEGLLEIRGIIVVFGFVEEFVDEGFAAELAVFVGMVFPALEVDVAPGAGHDRVVQEEERTVGPVGDGVRPDQRNDLRLVPILLQPEALRVRRLQIERHSRLAVKGQIHPPPVPAGNPARNLLHPGEFARNLPEKLLRRTVISGVGVESPVVREQRPEPHRGVVDRGKVESELLEFMVIMRPLVDLLHLRRVREKDLLLPLPQSGELPEVDEGVL